MLHFSLCGEVFDKGLSRVHRDLLGLFEIYLICGWQAILQVIWKGKIIDSEEYHESFTERIAGANDCSIGKQFVNWYL